ncbi:MAG: hypothetical protein QW717_03505 [Candidatus Bathyarchaeia archaeon]
MKKMIDEKRGQFIIIAALMIAIMIVSIGALMHRAVTYYRHEPWEEYLALIGNIELNSKRLVELSLANYSRTLDENLLKTNLDEWKADLSRIYLGRGVTINCELANGLYDFCDTSINYLSGLNHSWYKQRSFSAANAIFTLDITSIGLTGYRFTTLAFLDLTIIGVSGKKINVTVTMEDKMFVFDLGRDNFQVNKTSDNANIPIVSVEECYDVARKEFVYVIECSLDVSSTSVKVKVCDFRGIQVIARYSP